ncbi:MAG: TetR/AcrR family transcriptional regulator [Lautropia sp.]
MPPSSASGHKERYHHGDLKPALRAAARARLDQGGATAISLREIAQAVGVSHAAVYRHYGDREALLADLAEEGFRTLTALNRRAIAATRGGPARQLKACGRAYVAFGTREPHLLQLMFGPEIRDWQAHPGLAAAGSELAAVFEGVIRAGQAGGDLRGGDHRDLSLFAWSIVHGLSLLLAGDRIPGVRVDAAFAERAARSCTDLSLEGIARSE